MTDLPHSHRSHHPHWMFLLFVLLSSLLARVVVAQDFVQGEEVTSLEITATPEETLIPADELPTVAVPPDQFVIPVATQPPSFASQPAPPLVASFSIFGSATRLLVNDVLFVTFAVQDLTNVYRAVVVCQSDPALLRGIQVLNDQIIAGENGVLADSGFQNDGWWLVSGTQINPAMPISGSGILWHLSYQVIASGVSQIDCQVQLEDESGQLIPLTMTGSSLIVEGIHDVPLDILTDSDPIIASVAFDGSETPLLLSVLSSFDGDADENGIVDEADVSLVINHFGGMSPVADLNGDGIVNIFDLVIVSVNAHPRA